MLSKGVGFSVLRPQQTLLLVAILFSSYVRLQRNSPRLAVVKQIDSSAATIDVGGAIPQD